MEPGRGDSGLKVYQLRAWRQAQAWATIRPITGLASFATHLARMEEVVKRKATEAEFPKRSGSRCDLSGMTWMKKAHNRAYKDRRCATSLEGMPAPTKCCKRLALEGRELPPEGVERSRHGAGAGVDQTSNAGDPIEGEYTETTEPDDFEPEPGEEVWADWKNPAHAKAWSHDAGQVQSWQPHGARIREGQDRQQAATPATCGAAGRVLSWPTNRWGTTGPASGGT